MSSTREQTTLDDGPVAAPNLVRLRARPGVGVGLRDLPIAVGFGSPMEAAPRRLRAVPGLPDEAGAAPASGRQGRIIALPGAHPGADLPTQLLRPLRSKVGVAAAAPRGSSLTESVPLRLTSRGRAVLLAAAAAIGVAVIVCAWFGAAASAPPPRSAEPARVVVHDGDTLWSIAGRIAANRDPRAVVDRLLRINRLETPALVPGQVLRTR